METGTLIRRARQRRGLSQQALAHLARTSQAHVSQIECGRISPTISTLRALLAAAGAELVVDERAARGVVDDDDLRAFRALSMEQRLADSFAAAQFAGALHGRARR